MLLDNNKSPIQREMLTCYKYIYSNEQVQALFFLNDSCRNVISFKYSFLKYNVLCHGMESRKYMGIKSNLYYMLF